jgi:hypothetical protein
LISLQTGFLLLLAPKAGENNLWPLPAAGAVFKLLCFKNNILAKKGVDAGHGRN